MYGLGGELDSPDATQRGRYLVMEESIAGCSVAMKLPSESKWPETTGRYLVMEESIAGCSVAMKLPSESKWPETTTATPSTICSSRPPS